MPINKQFLEKHVTDYFVETGTYLGEGIDVALDCGFKNVRSVELSKDLYEAAKNKYKNDRRVQLYFGSSQNELKNMIKDINVQMTFWLDGHWSGGNTAKGDINSPLVYELETIKNHNIKNHIILIDDLRMFPVAQDEYGFDLDLNKIKKIILGINSKYEFFYADGHVPNDILVAIAPNQLF